MLGVITFFILLGTTLIFMLGYLTHKFRYRHDYYDFTKLDIERVEEVEEELTPKQVVENKRYTEEETETTNKFYD